MNYGMYTSFLFSASVRNENRITWLVYGAPFQEARGKYPPADDANCAFQGYDPAGGVRDVEKIEAPVAKLEKNGLLAMLGDNLIGLWLKCGDGVCMIYFTLRSSVFSGWS